MIAKFDTSGGSSSKGGSNTMIYVIGAAIVAFVAYTYFIKPEMDKKKAQQAK